eukprot:jgi/Hompol1/1021/HPOL_004420-RA
MTMTMTLSDEMHPFNFVIGASVALLSACLSSLGVNLQASALKAQRELNMLAESASLSQLHLADPIQPSSAMAAAPTAPSNARSFTPAMDPGIFEILMILAGLRSAHISGRPLMVEERNELWRRLFIKSQWYLGFALYLLCQLFGSVVALGFISPVVLAPLGSAGLIFNIIFSSIFIGTHITRYDWAGTVLIVIGCAIVSTFGSTIPETRQTIDDLIRLYSRPAFIAFFSTQVALVVFTFILIKYLEFNLTSLRTLMSRSAHGSFSGISSPKFSITNSGLVES